MASKSKSNLAALPRSEICAYWVLSFGSHLYSFYELHRFSKGVIGGACNLFSITTLALNDHEESKCCYTTDNSVDHLIPEHEAGLEREFQLQKGFLGGFKKDPNDFEWSFWSNWAKKSLLCTLFGHAVISKLSSILIPKLKVSVIAGYGLLVACGTLGIKGVAVIMVHLGLSLGVAQFCRPSMSWCCALLLLSTLHIPPLQELKRSWYETEEEYYLLLFSVAVCGLRFISFSLDHCWRPLEATRLEQLCWLTAYSFYHPLFYNGPIITFKDFVEQMQRPAEKSVGRWTLLLLVAKAGRIVMWWLTAEYMIHFMYMHTIQTNETYLEILPPWAMGGLALALVQFFYVKYLVLFGLPSLLATLDNLVPPKLPRCVSIMYSFTGMWRHFDEGLYQWLIRYVYVPLGGSHHGPLWKVLSTGLAFGFVCLWHGGHDYLQYWALMNWAGVLVENGLRALLTSRFILPSVERGLSAPARRRCAAVLFAVSTAMLILSNLVFLGGIHVGRIFWKRVVIQGWPMMVPSMLAFLYCFAQIGLEWKNNCNSLSL